MDVDAAGAPRALLRQRGAFGAIVAPMAGSRRQCCAAAPASGLQNTPPPVKGRRRRAAHRTAAKRALRICIARGFKRRQSAQTARKSEEKHAPSFGFVKLPWQLARSVSLHHREPHTLPSLPATPTDKLWRSSASADDSQPAQLSFPRRSRTQLVSLFPSPLCLSLSPTLPYTVWALGIEAMSSSAFSRVFTQS